MNVQVISSSYFEAAKQHRAYREALKTHREPYLLDLSRCYWHLKRKRGIIDVLAAIKHAGVNDQQDPKLAIAPANLTRIEFERYNPGGGQFRNTKNHNLVFDVPNNSFPMWKTEGRWNEIARKRIEVNVPIVPAHLLPRGSLHRYFILWEVEEWDARPPKDPILLKRINRNLFAVFATWDLTPLEQALVHGR